jgi:S-(hydroxymethyl)glutathione dehydrogenase/alcohol dehydrogenase
MKCQGAVLRGVGEEWEVREITLDPPREGEVLVKMAVAGICRSDDHFATGDSVPLPEMPMGGARRHDPSGHMLTRKVGPAC